MEYGSTSYNRSRIDALSCMQEAAEMLMAQALWGCYINSSRIDALSCMQEAAEMPMAQALWGCYINSSRIDALLCMQEAAEMPMATDAQTRKNAVMPLTMECLLLLSGALLPQQRFSSSSF